MPGIAVVGKDTAGGKQLGGGQSKLTVGGALVVVLGDPIESHGKSPHNGATMVQASSKFTVQGKPVCLAGHAASCGHATSGQANFTVGS